LEPCRTIASSRSGTAGWTTPFDYEFSADLPSNERYNLADQLRRAATSIPLNNAEGAGCATDAEFAHFLSYAYRSLKEAATAIELACRLYPALRGTQSDSLLNDADELSRMVYALRQRVVNGHGHE
jgi:four helix bundle protein